MSTLRLRVRQAIGDAVYLGGRRGVPRDALAVLMYHAVTPTPVDDPGQESVSAELFERQIATVLQAGVRVVSLEQGLATLATGIASGPMATVVFDDGYVGLHDHAADVLVRQGITATVFLATGSIGRPTFAWAPGGMGRPLTWSEARRLVTAGWTIGSHTHDHPLLSRLSDAEVREQLRTSRRCLEDRLGVTARLFAYPYGAHGAYTARTMTLVREEGFVAACSTVWGLHRRGDDPFQIRRMRVSWCDSPREMRKLLAGCYDWYRAVQRLQSAPTGAA